MKVVKFGGSSLADSRQIEKACEIILADKERRLVVVSAPGKRTKGDTKMTDLLIEMAEKHFRGENAKKELNLIIERFDGIIKGLGLSSDVTDMIVNDLNGRLDMSLDNKEKFFDTIKAAGEDNNAKIVAAYLAQRGVDAVYVDPREAGLLLNNEYGNARLLPESYGRLRLLKKKNGIMIFPGFFGYSKEGDVVTFSRGGSDITGSILAAAIKADLYENFTDVDSVYAADPSIVENPTPISAFTYREMRELSYAGFSILHEETLEPVYRMGIPVCIKNTNNPAAPGTVIAPTRELNNGPVIGIASGLGFCSIYVSKYMMNREVGFGRKILAILEDEGLSYEHIPSGIDNVSIILGQRQFDEGKEKRVVGRIKEELGVDDILVERDRALVMIVGEGMMSTVGITARAAKALSQAKVNIEMINQGSSEVSMMFGIKEKDNSTAIKALYNEFFRN
ncbi:MAG: aspartate kinase [Clostridium sp.]|nr:aspartate kinase [Clostridium sp.]